MPQQIDIVANLLMKVDGAEAGINKLKSSLSKLEIPKGLENGLNKSFSNLDSIFERYRKQLNKGFDTKADVSNMSKIGKELDSELTKVSDHIHKLTGERIDFKIDSEPVKRASRDLEEILEKRRQLVQQKLEIKVDTQKEGINNIKQLLEEFQRVVGNTKAGNAVGNALFHLDTGDLEKALPYLREAENSLGRIGDKKKTAFSATGFTLEGALTKAITELTQTDNKFSSVNDKAKLFQRILAEAQAGQLKDVDSLLARISQGFDKNAASARDAAKAAQEYAQSSLSMQQQLNQLQQSTQYFFGLRNMINLLKRGVSEAVQTVKELDAAMTETAVVTNFDVGDMWAKLPEYTANANALGATVQDMYESTTLYYQQGLNAQQAMGIAAETMKMARIGGLEAAEATDMMTAALRGFNMELNETSAQRINDVYSNLAAKTASNTEELGTAMQRTASIAASAGMSFEGTTAFLAQAIETTREPAENLGTAMKTIIARFQELKKNPLEMTEVDGEEVDYNKVDAALKTIGVDLKDTNGQFRNLDQVFLDISQRWNSLTQTQQRYIATTAAGSRQQSRFIAMMSNYDRTMQLMDYANNADGASDEQFGKTLESLEAKLNKFQNAWKQFLMNIMNDSWTKGIVDGATTVVNAVNNIISALSGGSKSIKSALSIFTAFTALKVAGRGANALIGGLGGMIDPQSTARAGMRTGIIGRNSAQAINQPIVHELQSIRQLVAQKINQSNLGKQAVSGPYDEYNRFKAARSAISEMGGKGSVNNLTKQLYGLSAQSQNTLMRSNSASFRAATNSILDNYGITNRKDIRKGERFLNDQRKSAQITAGEYYKALQDPGLLKQAMVKAGVQKDNPAYQYLDDLDKRITQKAASLQTKAEERYEGAIAKARADGKEITEEAYKRGKEALDSNQAKENYRKQANEELGGKAFFETSGFGKALDGIGKLGSGISQAGMGIQAFSSLLTGSANPAIAMFGSILTSVGGLVSGIGMGISGLSAGFTALASSTAMETAASWLVTAAKGPEAASSAAVAAAASALTGGLLALVAVIAAVVIAHKKYIEDIKKDAEEVTNTYKDKSSKNQSNISNLKQWKDELATLSQGVDSNGLNVSLDSSDYARYLEIVDGIAEINPSIVQGYNAQGHAIIDNNKALEETLALEEANGKQILENYTNEESLSKLMKARNLERVKYNKGTKSDDAGQTVQTSGYDLKPKNKMRAEAKKIGQQIISAQEKGLIDLSGFNIDFDAVAAGEEAATNAFIQEYNKIRQRVNQAMDNAGDEWSENSRNAIIKGFDAYGEAAEELDELVQPMYEMLSTKMSQSKAFEGLNENFKLAYQQVLRSAVEDADLETPEEMGDFVDGMIEEFERIGPEFESIMEDVDYAREQFAEDFNEQNYEAHTEDAIDRLNELKETFKDQPGGEAWIQWIDNTIRQIENRTIEGVQTIEEAFNTLNEEISAAEGATERFQKATEKDLSTAADGMKSIFDTAMEKDDNGNYKHRGWNGDNTYWAAARELLGDEVLNSLNGDKAAVDSLMDSLEPMLREGPEGFANFADKVRDSKDELQDLIDSGAIEWDEDENFISKIDDSIDSGVWTKLATALGMSEQVLISLLNKGKQFANIDFSDNKAIRTAMANDPNAVTGKTETYYDETGQQHERKIYFMTDEELRSAMGEYEYQTHGEEKRQDLRKDGMFVAQAIEKYKGEDAVSNITKLTNALGIDLQKSANINKDLAEKVGEKYSQEDFRTLALAAAEAQKGGELTEEERQSTVKAADKEYTDHLENLENPVESIDSKLSQLISIESQKNIKEGQLTKDMLQGDSLIDKVRGEEGVKDSLANYFSAGEDQYGNKLTEESYNKTLGELTDLQTGLNNYKTILEDGKKAAERNGLDTSLYDQEIGKVDSAITGLANAIEQGKKKFEEDNSEPPSETSSPDVNENTSSTNASISSENKGEESGKDNRNFLQKLNDLFITSEKAGIENMNAANSQAEENTRKQNEFYSNLSNLFSTSVKQEQQARAEQNAEATGPTAEDLRARNSQWWSNLFSGSDQNTQPASSTSGSQPTETNTDLSTAAQSLTTAGETLNTAITSLTTAGETLNTAGQNLISAAANLNKSNNGNNPLAPTKQYAPGAPSSIPQNQPVNQNSTFTVNTEDGSAKLNELKQLAVDTKATVDQGATFTITVSGAKKLTDAAKAAQSLNENSGAKTISVSAGSLNTTQLSQDIKNISRSEAKIKVKADTSTFTTQVNNAVRAANNKTASISITPSFEGTWTKHATVYVDHQAHGHNNHGYASAPKAGSAARGSYGQVGPKGKGGLTLTGELGYEIAWLPSENRSMILGANGPQMIDLPGNAVVWTHEQSKKIMKQKSIPAGSHATGKATVSGINQFLQSYRGTTNSTSSSSSSSTAQYIKDTGNSIKKEVKKTTDKISRVSNWWENIARKTEDSQRKMDSSAKTFEKYIKQLRATGAKAATTGKGNKYIQNIGEYIGYNKIQEKRAKQELKTLNDSKLTKKQRKSQKKLKKQYKKGNVAIEQISYTDKKGKSQTKFVDLSQYIKGGQVSDKKLKKISDVNKRKAVSEAANKVLNEKRSKRNAAQDNIQKANEALEQMGQDLYKTFHDWEIELTRIWNITQKIEQVQAKISRNESITDLMEAQLNSGARKSNKATAKTSVDLFKQRINQQNEIITQRQKAINQTKADINSQINGTDDKQILQSVKSILKNKKLDATTRKEYETYQKELEDKIAITNTALKYTKVIKNGDGTVSIDFNTAEFEKARLNGDLTGDMAKAVQDWVKETQDLSKNLDELNESFTQDIAEYYNLLKDLKDDWADYESQLIQISEESNKKTIDDFRKISDSVKKAIDKLLSEVKRLLEERRKQEDNRKTEQDISKKQQRLAALQADTSGGHQVEIAQLQQEIADAQQNYQRSLEDQLLEKLQNQADLAAEQREKQIEIQEDLLTAVNNVALVEMWMKDPEQFQEQIWEAFKVANNYDQVGAAGKEKIERDFQPFINGLKSNQEKQAEIADEIQKSNQLAEQRLTEEKKANTNTTNVRSQKDEQGKLLYNPKQAHDTFGFSYKDLKEISGYSAKEFHDSGVSASEAKGAGFTAAQLKGVNYSLDDLAKVFGVADLKKANYSFGELAKKFNYSQLKSGGFTARDFKANNIGYNNVKSLFSTKELANAGYDEAIKILEQERKEKDLYDTFVQNFKNLDLGSGAMMWTVLPSSDKALFQSVVKKHKGEFVKNKKNREARISSNGLVYMHDGKGTVYTIDPWSGKFEKIKYSKSSYEKKYKNATNVKPVYKAALHQRGVKGYKTGGLANYTGPAWLDGTPSKPELVLNAQDTKNFIALKDVLSKAIGSAGAVENTYGNATYEININVDHLNNDYDVDKVVERVKKKIVQDSSYRNVTQVRKFR